MEQGPQKSYRATSYNCMSCRQWDRLGSIQSELKGSAIICLQGTRLPQKRGQVVDMLTSTNWTVCHAGFHSMSSSHSGVSICMNHRVIPREALHSYWVPSNPKVQGRILGIREKGVHRYIMHVCIYYPPCTSNSSIT